MLRLPRTLYDEMMAHCRREYPKEACGILAGERGPASPRLRSGRRSEAYSAKDGGVVAQVYPMRNVEASPIGYSMDPNEQLRIEKAMRQKGQRILGIYHSHTASAAYPSSVDVSLAISPDVAYVLISLMNREQPDIKSYRIDGATVTPEEVVIFGV